MKKYWLSPKIKWRTYKLLHDKTAMKDSGPTPKNFEKILWQMLHDRQLNIYITDKEVHGDTWFPTLSPIPKGASLITNLNKGTMKYSIWCYLFGQRNPPSNYSPN